MDKRLIGLDIRLKFSKLHNEIWYNFYIKVLIFLATLEVVNLIIGLVLTYCFGVNNATILCATIPNALICIILFTLGYMLQTKLKAIHTLQDRLDKELDLLLDYDKYNINYIYDEFRKVSEVQLPQNLFNKDN